jgi:cytochrome c553
MIARGVLTTAALVLVTVIVASTSDEGRVPERLYDTGLYTHGRPFSPQYPLWSDGAAKSRWVYLPPGTAIDATDQSDWNFPVGTKFWKEFRFNDRKIETRFLWRASPTRWVARSYVWNSDGTEARLAPEEGVPGVAELAPGKRHTIPSANDCLACHGARHTGPLGFNALQLSTDRDPNAIHGEPFGPEMVTLRTLVTERLIVPADNNLIARPPRIATHDPATRAVLGYFTANCGSCHNGGGEIAALGPSLKHSDLLGDGDAVARALIDYPTHWQAPGQLEGTTVLLNPMTPDKSAMLVRMRSRSPSSQMPPLGTVVRDQVALDTIRRWMEGRVSSARSLGAIPR